MRNALALLVLVGVGGGCEDDGLHPRDLSVAVPHNFKQINQEILQPLCGNFSVCHSTEGAMSSASGHPFDITKDPYGSLVNADCLNKQAKAEGKVRVKPCDAENSFLYIKLTLPVDQMDSTVGYGASMPKTDPHLPQQILDAFHDWIARGAHEDEPDDVTGSVCVTDDASVYDMTMMRDLATPSVD